MNKCHIYVVYYILCIVLCKCITWDIGSQCAPCEMTTVTVVRSGRCSSAAQPVYGSQRTVRGGRVPMTRASRGVVQVLATPRPLTYSLWGAKYPCWRGTRSLLLWSPFWLSFLSCSQREGNTATLSAKIQRTCRHCPIQCCERGWPLWPTAACRLETLSRSSRFRRNRRARLPPEQG